VRRRPSFATWGKVLGGLLVLCCSLTGAEPRPANGIAGLEDGAATFSHLGLGPASAEGAVRSTETHLYWGETHLHTILSTDGYVAGPTGIRPEQAYRYARGLPVIHPTVRNRVRIKRPLDFLIVTDHSDYAGLQDMLGRGEPGLVNSEIGKRLNELFKANPGVIAAHTRGAGQIPEAQMKTMYRPVASVPWLETVEAAERNNIPGKFTAFAGWEYSPTPDGRNLHRNIFSPAPASVLRQLIPYSTLDSLRPEDLWAWLQKEADRLHIDFVSIPHNSNMSDGLMFQAVDSDGRPITPDYARTRSRWEPAMEVTQIKGTSEAHPDLSPNDPFANFEIYNGRFSPSIKPRANRADYARYALMLGLRLERDVGVNPYKFGLVSGSDIHVGLSSTDEDAFIGATVAASLPEERNRNRTGNNFAVWGLSAGGTTATWATENTRTGIFSAFKRKEVYATTGARIQLRVFGGFGFPAAAANARDIAKVGYTGGVPMGGDLTNAPAGKAPQLLIRAVKDPIGANLDRVQVVKGWLDSTGETHEKIYNVAWSDRRKLDTQGSLPPVGDTVDIANARYTNTIGATQLAAVWKDPDFDPRRRAFYYVRVLEIPTPRQQVFDAIALGLSVEEIKKINLPTTIQERAYSSPIWYTPARER
jgi:hypothetical protein